jgi:hypothetical protein
MIWKSIIGGLIIGILMSVNTMLFSWGGYFLSYYLSFGFLTNWIFHFFSISEGGGWILGFTFPVIMWGLCGLVVGIILKKIYHK